MRRRQQRQPFKAQYYELSYVQINIYNTNMKALRREGVNLNKLLRSVAHRSVIMEIPIVSGKRRPQQSVKNTRRADVSKSLPTPQSNLDSSYMSATSVDNYETIQDEEPSNNGDQTKQGMEVSVSSNGNSVKTGVATDETRAQLSVEEYRGPLTSTPLLEKTLANFEDFRATNGFEISDSSIHTYSEPMAGNQSIRLTPGREENVMEMMDLIIEDELPPSPTALIHEETGHLRKLSQSPVEALSVSKLIHSNCSRRDCEAKITYTAEQLSQQLCCSLQPTLTDDYAKNLYERAVELNAAGTNLTNGCSGNELVVQKVEATPLESVLAATSAVALEKKDASNTVDDCCSSMAACTSIVRGDCVVKHETQNASAEPIREGAEILRYGTPTQEPINVENSEQSSTGTNNNEKKRGSRGRLADDHPVIFYCQMPGCGRKLTWRRNYGKVRLVDHVRTHWNKEVKACKLCGFKATCNSKVYYHHGVQHKGVPFTGIISLETSEDMKCLLEYWKLCFPDSYIDGPKYACSESNLMCTAGDNEK